MSHVIDFLIGNNLSRKSQNTNLWKTRWPDRDNLTTQWMKEINWDQIPSIYCWMKGMKWWAHCDLQEKTGRHRQRLDLGKGTNYSRRRVCEIRMERMIVWVGLVPSPCLSQRLRGFRHMSAWTVLCGLWLWLEESRLGNWFDVRTLISAFLAFSFSLYS